MKFTINKNLLIENLQIVQKAMAVRSNMPALTGIYTKVTDSKITLVTSNIDLAIKVEIENKDFKIEDAGECLIPGKLFVDVVRKFNGDEVSLELVQDNVLRIVSGYSDVTMNLLEVQDYPTQSFELNNKPIVVNGRELKEIIRQTTFATATLENKPILTGVNFRIYGNKLLAVSTDSFRLSRRISILDDDYPETNIIIPAKSLNELSKTIVSDEDDVEIYLEKGKVLFCFDNIVFQSRLLEGNYPDTTKLIPTDFPIVIKFNKMELIESIDRVSTMNSNNNTAAVVKLQVQTNGSVVLTSSSTELGTMTDVINPVDFPSMGEIKIAFSSLYIMDALKAFNGEEVYVKFISEIRQFIIESEDDKGLVELVLPLKTE